MNFNYITNSRHHEERIKLIKSQIIPFGGKITYESHTDYGRAYKDSDARRDFVDSVFKFNIFLSGQKKLNLKYVAFIGTEENLFYESNLPVKERISESIRRVDSLSSVIRELSEEAFQEKKSNLPSIYLYFADFSKTFGGGRFNRIDKPNSTKPVNQAFDYSMAA